MASQSPGRRSQIYINKLIFRMDALFSHLFFPPFIRYSFVTRVPLRFGGLGVFIFVHVCS